MKKIKQQIMELLKVLDDMKKSYDDFTYNEINRYLGDTFGSESESYINTITEILDKPKKDKLYLKDHINNAKQRYTDDADIIDEDFSNDVLKIALTPTRNQHNSNFQINFLKGYKRIQNVVINLNKLLDKPIKKVQSLEEMQHKKMLSIKEVESLYGVSKTQQQGFRGRLRNPLPYHKQSTKSKSANTKVYYKRNELEDWMENFL